jgi:hypothetical protein
LAPLLEQQDHICLLQGDIMSKNKQAFIGILPLLAVMAMAPAQLHSLNRGIASEQPTAVSQPLPQPQTKDVAVAKPEVKVEEPKKEEPKKEEPKSEVAKVDQKEPSKEEPKKEEPKAEVAKVDDKKEEPKKEPPKEEAKITVAEPKKEEPKKEQSKDDCTTEELKTISSSIAELVTQQKNLVSQMTNMQQMMQQQMAQLEWKMLFSSINQANNYNQGMQQYFNPNPYGAGYNMPQIYSPFESYQPFNPYMMGGMGGMGGGIGGMFNPYQQQPMQIDQNPYSIPSGLGYNLQGTPQFVDPRLTPFVMNPGDFGTNSFGFNMVPTTPPAQTQIQQQVGAVAQPPVLPGVTGQVGQTNQLQTPVTSPVNSGPSYQFTL